MAEWLKAPEADMQLAQMRQELIAQPAGSNPATSTNAEGRAACNPGK